MLKHLLLLLISLILPSALSAPAKPFYTVSVFEHHKVMLDVSPNYALAWTLLEGAAKRQGVRLAPYGTSWQAGLKRLETGRLDFVFGAYHSDERAKWASYTLPLAKDTTNIFTRSDNPIERIEDINFATAKVGVSQGSFQHELAKQMGFISLYPIDGRAQIYDMLKEGRIEYLLYGKTIADFYCYYANPTERNNRCIKTVGKPLSENALHLIALKTSTANAAVVRKINEGLFALSQDGTARLIFKRYGFSDADFERWRTLVSDHFANFS